MVILEELFVDIEEYITAVLEELIENTFKPAVFLSLYAIILAFTRFIAIKAREESIEILASREGRILISILMVMAFVYIYTNIVFLSLYIFTAFFLALILIFGQTVYNGYVFSNKLIEFLTELRIRISPRRKYDIMSFILFIYIMYNVCSLFKPVHISTNMLFDSIDYDYLLGLLGVTIVYTQAFLTSIKKKELDPKVNSMIWLAGLSALLAFYKILPIIIKTMNIIAYTTVVVKLQLEKRS